MNTPPEDSILVPITAFKAFHNNYTGIPRTGEMKLALTIPIDDIHDAMEVATARDEILWVEISKIKFGGVAKENLAAKIEEQTREREEIALKKAKRKKRRTGPASLSELDWET